MGVDRLDSATAALAHQRQWFTELCAERRPFALVNADVPHEIFRAHEMAYVVNQWWSSVAASRGGAQRALDALATHGLPRNSEPYNTIALGGALQAEPPVVPRWGALPRPALVVADVTGDPTRKIFQAWRDVVGVPLFEMESPVQPVTSSRWWERIAHDWEHVVGSDRIDVMVAELCTLSQQLEELTGTPLDEERLTRILELGNEQAAWNRRTRDLIAETSPLPVRVTDTIPAVMLPQWHRGSEWGRDAARALHDDVRARVDGGIGVVERERARLMWIGRGLWFDLGFYRHFEEAFGAVFVWSMYLAIAADGYARYGGDPLRALSSRFIGFHERLYVSPWSSDWYVQQAQQHGVHGVVHLVSDDARGSWATTQALRDAGFPVFELHADNADASGYDTEGVRAEVARWLRRDVL